MGGGDKRTESKSNQNAFYKHMKLSKHKLLNLVKQKRGIIGTHMEVPGFGPENGKNKHGREWRKL